MANKRQISGFTLIELLIVIAIILILIAIALPNFMEAQSRARLTRTKGDMRGIVTAVEAFRTERDALLIDFWDDGTPESGVRWREKLARVGRNPQYEYTTFDECFYPLTSPVKYMTSVPPDLWNDPKKDVGFSAGEKGQSYIYFDDDPLFKFSWDHSIDRFVPTHPAQIETNTRPLQEGEFAILSLGPDGVIGIKSLSRDGQKRGYPYSPTNGTLSGGDIVFRSQGKPD
ncbi:MAG: hypothetical protein GHCLOJNM_01502 [bacterium]|nr:hypothetical protein [bacterium]